MALWCYWCYGLRCSVGIVLLKCCGTRSEDLVLIEEEESEGGEGEDSGDGGDPGVEGSGGRGSRGKKKEDKSKPMSDDFYEVLGIDAVASGDEVKKAYRRGVSRL